MIFGKLNRSNLVHCAHFPRSRFKNKGSTNEEDLTKLAKAQRREASAPAARFLGYFSRKGAKNAKDAKGRKDFVLPLRLCELCVRSYSLFLLLPCPGITNSSTTIFITPGACLSYGFSVRAHGDCTTSPPYNTNNICSA